MTKCPIPPTLYFKRVKKGCKESTQVICLTSHQSRAHSIPYSVTTLGLTRRLATQRRPYSVAPHWPWNLQGPTLNIYHNVMTVNTNKNYRRLGRNHISISLSHFYAPPLDCQTQWTGTSNNCIKFTTQSNLPTPNDRFNYIYVAGNFT